MSDNRYTPCIVLPGIGQSKVELLDLQGRTVRTLWNGNANGSVSLSVVAQPGIYLVRIQGAGIHETHKVAVK